MSSKCKPLACVCGNSFLPQRIVIIIFCLLGVLIARTQKSDVVLNMASDIQNITEASKKVNKSNTGEAIDMMKQTFQAIFIRISFPIAQWIMWIPAGIFVDKFGAKWFYFGGVLVSSIITLFMPLILTNGANWSALSILRFCMGIAHSVIFPSVAVLVARWTPFSQRALLGAFCFSIYPLSNFLNYELYFIVLSLNIYYITGALGLVWCALFPNFVFENPSKHPRITEKEKTFLKEEIDRNVKLKWPCRNAMSSKGVWALILSQIGQEFLLVAILPKVIFDDTDMVFRGCSCLALWPIAIGIGGAVDYGINVKNWSIKWTRRITTFIAFILSCGFTVIGLYLNDNTSMTSLMAIAIISTAPNYSGQRINHMDITVNFIGTLIGLLYFCADPVIRIIEMVFGLLTKDMENKFPILGWTLFGVNAILATCYLLLAQEERVDWDYPPYDEDE